MVVVQPAAAAEVLLRHAPAHSLPPSFHSPTPTQNATAGGRRRLPAYRPHGERRWMCWVGERGEGVDGGRGGACCRRRRRQSAHSVAPACRPGRRHRLGRSTDPLNHPHISLYICMFTLLHSSSGWKRLRNALNPSSTATTRAQWPAGVATRNLEHWAQRFRDRGSVFRQYDFGALCNRTKFIPGGFGGRAGVGRGE